MAHICASSGYPVKIKSLYMLWSQYKLARIRRTEFLRKEITGILNIPNWNSNFLTLQTSEFQKIIRPESSDSNTESEFRLQWGSQKSEPKIGIPNQDQIHVVTTKVSQTSQLPPSTPLFCFWWELPLDQRSAGGPEPRLCLPDARTNAKKKFH